MKITKTQLRRIIKESISQFDIDGPGDLLAAHNVNQEDYDEFVSAIEAGLGTIESDDVQRQWETMFNVRLGARDVAHIIDNLEVNGIINDDNNDNFDDHDDLEDDFGKDGVYIRSADRYRSDWDI